MLVGLVFGDLKIGIIFGGILELMVLGWMNVGFVMVFDIVIVFVILIILVIIVD